MTKFGEDIIEGLKEAIAYTSGEVTGAKTRVVQVADVRAIRESLGMSQSEFAEAYRIPLATLKGWEQGRRSPAGFRAKERRLRMSETRSTRRRRRTCVGMRWRMAKTWTTIGRS